MRWPQSSALIPTAILCLTVPIFFYFLGPKILPQRQIIISLPDELDDLSLFHKAIVAESTSSPPPSRIHFHLSVTKPRKIAFMFLTNSPLQFSPIWDKFFATAPNNQYNIYIHADPSVKIPSFTGVFENRTIPNPKRTQRSSPTLISAARRLMAYAMLNDSANAYFALISQTCIPLHSFKYLYDFLFDKQKLAKTYEFPSYIEIIDKEPILWDRYNARGENVMLPEVEFDKFRIGSQFFVITRKHALMVIKDRVLWRKFKLPCLNLQSCYPEEHYFPTLLSMQDPGNCSHYTLTRVNWTDSLNGHPHTYYTPEVSAELIYTLREANISDFSYMFARKFAPETLNPLMEIADSVIFKD